MPFEEFLSRADDVHDVFYDYVKESYKGVQQKVTIVCPEHGKFQQAGFNHLRGSGCPRCKNSKGETIIAKTLSRLGVLIKREYAPGIRGVNGGLLKFDFFVPAYNLFIEYDGEHHFRPVKYNQRTTDRQAKEVFERTQIHDELKNDFVKSIGDGHVLLRVSYIDKDKISALVNEAIDHQREMLIE